MPQVLKKANDPLFRLKDIKSATRNKENFWGLILTMHEENITISVNIQLKPYRTRNRRKKTIKDL